MDEKIETSANGHYEQCQEYCDGNIAIFYCPQCLTNYCAECFDKEHKLKRRKWQHEKVMTPRRVCREHHLTLEYQNNSKYMCYMCVKELPPGELARNIVEPIDGVATVLKEKLKDRCGELEVVHQAIKKKIEASNESISSAIECARSEVRRFFTALNLLLNKQEESFQYQLTNLLHTTKSRAVFEEMKQALETTEELVKKGKALVCEENLIFAKQFERIAREMDELLDGENIKNFPLPTLDVSIHVHRHLLEMVRHPGYISTTFDECRESGNAVYKRQQTAEKREDSAPKIFEAKLQTKENESIVHPSAICSPPMSITGEDEETPYSLMPQYSRNSTPRLFSPDENSTLRPLAVHNVNDEDLNCPHSSLCSCSGQSSNSTEIQAEQHQIKEKLDVLQKIVDDQDLHIKSKENHENKNGKRTLGQNTFFQPYARKTRRTEASKELNQCDKILTELWVSDDSFPFARPVDQKKVPQYYEVIKNPIDLTRIKTKLQSILYDSVYDFVDDMKLLFDNCYLFNSAFSSTYESGVKLEKQFMKLMRDSFPSLYYQSSIPQNNQGKKTVV